MKNNGAKTKKSHAPQRKLVPARRKEILCASDVFVTLGGRTLWRKRGLTQRETAKTKTAHITINLTRLLIRIAA
jgi:hypothetical protein